MVEVQEGGEPICPDGHLAMARSITAAVRSLSLVQWPCLGVHSWATVISVGSPSQQ